MKSEILSVGTELLLGQITNTNATFLSEQLNALGIPVYYHTVIGDNQDRLLHQLKRSLQRSDVLLITGGLGPTQDDMTKESVAHLLQRSLRLDEETMDRIRRFFEHRDASMTENNKKQALVIEGSTVFPNDHGLACGMAVEAENKHILLLPGPPRELRPMFEQQVTPYLKQLRQEESIVHSKVMRFAHIGESVLETELKDLIEQQTSPTIAPLAKDGEVTLRLTSFASSIQEAEREMEETIRKIQSRVGAYQYGWDDDSLESVLIEQLQKQELSLATAESCTGGLLSHHLTRVSGASQVFKGGIICYTSEVKKQLGVDDDLIANDGVVSESCARVLAENIKQMYEADIGVSVTGVAGPDPQEGKQVGLVYVGIALPGETVVKQFQLGGNRTAIQHRASLLAMFHTFRRLS